jgi:hypothetical protein
MSLLKSFFYRYSTQTFLFLAAFFIRFPFFFRDYVDKDESTFILMGQSIADGHLPYDHLWDLKPPLLFYFFALIEKIFPHSFFAIRFFGTIIIFLSTLLLLKIVEKAKLKNGFFIALGYVLLSSEFGSLQGVMSEHFAVFFLLLGLVFFLRKRNKYDWLIAGIALGCAILCKLNYAYAIAALIIFYLLDNRRRGFKQAIGNSILLVFGIGVPTVLIAIPFIAVGKVDLFVNSVFLAPLEYARALNYSWIDKLKTTWWIIAVTAFASYFSVRFSKEENKSIAFACIAVLIGTVYTFYSSGIVNGHYLVQVYPFLLILLFGVIIQRNIQVKFIWAALVVIVLSIESLLEYGQLMKAFQNPAEYRPTFEVVRELKKRGLENAKIFFVDYHIGYWILHQYPLTKSTTHPSNLARSYLFKYYNSSSKTSLDELKYIMEEVRPQIIVSQENGLNFFTDSSSENQYFRNRLDEDFKKIYEDARDHIFIWKRNENK